MAGNGKLTGYIVLYEGTPTWSENRKFCPKERGVLYSHSRKVTVFETRRDAEKAIHRTQIFAADNSLPWTGRHEIVQLERLATRDTGDK